MYRMRKLILLVGIVTQLYSTAIACHDSNINSYSVVENANGTYTYELDLTVEPVTEGYSLNTGFVLDFKYNGEPVRVINTSPSNFNIDGFTYQGLFDSDIGSVQSGFNMMKDSNRVSYEDDGPGIIGVKETFNVVVSVTAASCVSDIILFSGEEGSGFICENAIEIASCGSVCQIYPATIQDDNVCGEYTGKSGKVFDETGVYYDTIPGSGGCDTIYEYDLTVYDTNRFSLNYGDNYWTKDTFSILPDSGVHEMGRSRYFSIDPNIRVNQYTGELKFAYSTIGNYYIYHRDYYGCADTGRVFVQLHDSTEKQVKWHELDDDIYGKSTDNLGQSVSLSEDGERLAAGAPNYESGRVKFYEYEGSSWKLHSTITWGEDNDRFGAKVSLSADGNRVAIGATDADNLSGSSKSGAVLVYEWQDTNWVMLGDVIYGSSSNEELGENIALSGNGEKLVLASPYADHSGSNDLGSVSVYELINNEWSLVSDPLLGEAGNKRGYTAAINNSGTIVGVTEVIGTSKYVNAYEVNSSGWTQIGDTMFCGTASNFFSSSLSFDSSASRIAIGDKDFDSELNNSGLTRVMELRDNSWAQVGDSLIGSFENGYYGISVQLSYNGNRLIASEYRGDVSNEDKGIVRVFNYHNGDWVRIGEEIYGQNAGENFGISVAISGDGGYGVIGTPYNDLTGVNAGYVKPIRIYGYDVDCSETFGSLSVEQCSPFVGPSGRVYYKSGAFIDTILNVAGCDSLIAMQLAINQNYDTLDIDLCNENEIVSPSGNHIWTTNGTYFDTLTNRLGCDSIITFNLAFRNTTYDSLEVATCGIYTSPSGKEWDQEGVYNDTIASASGCDSVITVSLTIGVDAGTFKVYLDNFETTENPLYVEDGSSYNVVSNGDYVLPPKAGVDPSGLGFHVFTCEPSFDFENELPEVDACYLGTNADDGFDYNDMNAGDKSYSLPSYSELYILPSTMDDVYSYGNGQFGVDENNDLCWGYGEVLHVIYGTNPQGNCNSQATIDTVVCDTFESPSGKILTSNGNIQDTIPNQAGCDSVILFNVTFATSHETYSWVLCPNESLTVISGNYNINEVGIYLDTAVNNSGCLTYYEYTITAGGAIDTQEVTACLSYQWGVNGVTYTTSGEYQEIFTAKDGCDSIVVLSLTLSCDASWESKSICAEDGYYDLNTLVTGDLGGTWSGTNVSGGYLDTEGLLGDSLDNITLSLTYYVGNNFETGEITLERCGSNICQATESSTGISSCGSYLSPSGRNLATSGVYIDTIQNAAGCDSLITIDLHVIELIDTLVFEACNIGDESGVFNLSNNNLDDQWSVSIYEDSNLDKLIDQDEFYVSTDRELYFEAENGACSSSGPVTLNVSDQTFVVRPSFEDSVVVYGEEVMLKTNANSFSNFSWHNDIDTIVYTSATPTVTVYEDVVYEVYVTYWGCIGYADIHLTVDEGVSTGSEHFGFIDEVFVYPNPATDKLYLSTFEDYEEYKIFKIDGALIMEGALKSEVIELKDIPEGVYFLQLTGNDLKVFKIVRQ